MPFLSSNTQDFIEVTHESTEKHDTRIPEL